MVALSRAQGLKRKASPLKIASFGHSFMSRGFSSSASLNQFTDVNIAQWACRLLGQRVTTEMDLNFGVSGERSDQILARIGDVLTSEADIVVLDAWANDITQSIDLATIQDNATQMLDLLTDAGKIVMLTPVASRADASNTLANIRKMDELNRFLFEKQSSYPSVYAVNDLDVWNDLNHTATLRPAGGITANVLANVVDLLHPSARGAFLKGYRLYEALRGILPAQDDSRWSPYGTVDASANPHGNLIANPLMAGTANGTLGTGMTGEVVSGWTLERLSGSTNITAVGSKVGKALINGDTLSQQQIVATNPGSGLETVLFRRDRSLAFYTAGTVTSHSYMDVEVDADEDAIAELCLVSQEITGGTSVTSEDGSLSDSAATASVLPNIAWEGTFRTPKLTSQASNTVLRDFFKLTVSPGAVATIRLSNARRLVD